MSFISRLLGFKAAPVAPINQSIVDGIYGLLIWDPETRWWIGTYECPINGTFRLEVTAESDSNAEPSAILRDLFVLVQARIADTRKMVIDDFLPSFNEDWNDDKPLSFEEFSRLICPESIHVWDYGCVEVSYKEATDDEFLGGHSLIVSFHEDGSSTVGLEG